MRNALRAFWIRHKAKIPIYGTIIRQRHRIANVEMNLRLCQGSLIQETAIVLQLKRLTDQQREKIEELEATNRAYSQHLIFLAGRIHLIKSEKEESAPRMRVTVVVDGSIAQQAMQSRNLGGRAAAEACLGKALAAEMLLSGRSVMKVAPQQALAALWALSDAMDRCGDGCTNDSMDAARNGKNDIALLLQGRAIGYHAAATEVRRLIPNLDFAPAPAPGESR